MKKRIHMKQAGRKKAHLMSVLLSNGNLVVPKIFERDPFVACWVEVEPGSIEFKRWFPVHEKEEKERDPRTYPEYANWLRAEYPQYVHTLTGVFKPPTENKN